MAGLFYASLNTFIKQAHLDLAVKIYNIQHEIR